MTSIQTQVSQLRQYAIDQVAAARDRISANLARKGGGSPLVLDVAFPGAAYFSVAAGGVADVLHILGEDLVKVDRFSGSSGGACSLFLILANESAATAKAAGGRLCPDASLLLRSYYEYADSQGHNSFSRCLSGAWQMFAGVTSFWESKYRALLRDDAAWHALRTRGFVAVSAKPHMFTLANKGSQRSGMALFEADRNNYVLHNFANREQAVQAYVATGEATALGFVRGIGILEAAGEGETPDSDPFVFNVVGTSAAATEEEMRSGSCKRLLPAGFCDGGHPVAFQCASDEVAATSASADAYQYRNSSNALLYYKTWFEDMSEAVFCTPESIERLYKRGVDRTIACLASEEFASGSTAAAEEDGKKDKMVIIMRDEMLQSRLARIGAETALTGGAFVNVGSHQVVAAAT